MALRQPSGRQKNYVHIKKRQKVFMKLKYLEEALIFITGVYSELCQRSKMRRFVKIVKNYKLLTVFAKCSILEAW